MCIFSHSAEQLNMTQPGISKSLSKLEAILGFRLFENGLAHLQDQLDAGELDLILVPEFLRKTPFGEGKGSSLATVCTFQVIIPNNHPLSSYEVLSLEDIIDLPLIMFDPSVSSGILEDTKRLFLPYGKSPKIACYYKSTYEMRTALMDNKGISIITNSYVYQMDAHCKRIPLDAKCWGTVFLYQKSTDKKPVLNFLEMIEALRPSLELIE